MKVESEQHNVTVSIIHDVVNTENLQAWKERYNQTTRMFLVYCRVQKDYYFIIL